MGLGNLLLKGAAKLASAEGKAAKLASKIKVAKTNKIANVIRKTCLKGKNCSATCIAANKLCLVSMSPPVTDATNKMAKFLKSRRTSAPPVKEAPTASATSVKKAEIGKEPPKPDAKSLEQGYKKLTPDQQEKVTKAAEMTDYRINKRLNERVMFDDANGTIKNANQQVVAPFQKMTPDEKAALSLYGQDGVKYYQQVNQMLRGGIMEESTPEKVAMSEFISKNLQSGLEKLPTNTSPELQRAVSGNFATELGKLKLGDTIVDKGFGSYTNNGAPTLNQFFKTDQPNAGIRILNSKAKEVAPVMEYSREGEHISLPGAKYKLVDIQEKGIYSRKTMGYTPLYTFEEII